MKVKKSHYEFKFHELYHDNNIVEITCKGAWFIVDDGYLHCLCTAPPMKNSLRHEDIRFSDWIESMREEI